MPGLVGGPDLGAEPLARIQLDDQPGFVGVDVTDILAGRAPKTRGVLLSWVSHGHGGYRAPTDEFTGPGGRLALELECEKAVTPD